MSLLSQIHNGDSGGSTRTKLNTLIDQTNLDPLYLFSVNSSDQPESMVHADVGVFSVNDFTDTLWYSVSQDFMSGGRWKVVEVRVSPYGGTPGDLANGGSTGIILEGLNYRFALEPGHGGRVDLRQVGIRCVEGQTGFHSRLSTLLAWAKNQQQQVTLVGTGVLSCTETVFLDAVNIDCGATLRFQGGTHAPNGATPGPPTFFTAQQTNTSVTIAPGSPVVVTQTAHGFSDNQEVMFGSTLRLPGNLAWLTRYFVKVVDANSYNLANSSGGAVINNASVGSGNHFAFYSPTGQALPAQSNIITQDYLWWNGTVQRTGIVVRAGTNASNKDFHTNRLIVWGDGNSDWTTPPSTTCIRHEADDSPNGNYDYTTNYSVVGCAIQGPSEKHRYYQTGIYCGFLCYMVNGSSADTLNIELHGTSCMNFYAEHHGVDTSTRLDLRCEGRLDPADTTLFANYIGGTDTPCVLIRNGKATTLAGMLRALNGLRQVHVGSVINATGLSTRFGVDTVQFDNLRFVHSKGIAVNIETCRHVAGEIFIKDSDNANGPLAANTPLVQIGRVESAGGLYVAAADILNFEGVNVGGSYADGYYPYGAHLGHYAISMGSALQFNPDSADGTKGTKRTGSTGFPTTLLAGNLEKWDAGIIDMQGSKGKITLGSSIAAGWLIVDELYQAVTGSGASSGVPGYTIDDSSSPAAVIGYRSVSTSGLVIT